MQIGRNVNDFSGLKYFVRFLMPFFLISKIMISLKLSHFSNLIVCRSKFDKMIISVPQNFIISSISSDTDEVPHKTAFHLCRQCLPKIPVYRYPE